MFQARACLAATALLAACATDVAFEEPAIVAEDAPLTAAVPDLSRGKRRTLVEGLTAAENQLFTSEGRLFVSGDEGVYEIVQQGTTYSTRELPSDAATCWFGGLTEYAGTLYANCYDTVRSNSLLYAAPLNAAPQLRAIHSLPGVALANGLTHDEAGNLYIASTFDGAILRLKLDPSDPLRVLAQESWLPSAGLFSNGLKYFDGKLYWTAFTQLRSAAIRDGGKPRATRDLSGALTYLDDLYVDGGGFLLDDYLNGRVLSLDTSARYQNATPIGTFNGPSSVQRALGRLGLSATALVVTERAGNRVSVFEP